MKAIKDNKVYTIDSGSKAEYLARGFDIYDDGGKMIARSPSATVPAAQYDELLAKYEELKAQSESKKKGKSGGEPDVSGTE